MSYHVRNPSLREGQRELQLKRVSTGYTVIPGNTQKRFTDTSDDRGNLSNDEADNSSVVTYEEAAFKANPNQPVVTYSTKKPNYPTGYSCEHSLFYARDDHDENVANAAVMLSHSEDISNDAPSLALNNTPVRLSVEFEIPMEDEDAYDEIISNVEALQWSFLNKISASTGLSKGCKIESQYDERTLVTALTSMNDMHTTFTDNEGNRRHSNSRKNRRRTRDVTANRELLATLPYPTSVYSITATRPKWTAVCSGEDANGNESDSNQCFTAEINFDVAYRGTAGESNLIEEYVQSIIHNQIALDATQLYAADITGLRWISNYEASAAFGRPDLDLGTLTPIPDAGERTKDESSGLFDGLILLATAVMLGLIWLCIHVFHRKKRRSMKGASDKPKRTDYPTGEKTDDDIETGSNGTGKTRDLQSKDSKDSLDSQDSGEAGKSCTQAMAKAIGMSPAASSALQSTSSSSPPRLRRHLSCPVSVDSPERSTGGLPPRPVMSKRTVSQPLKKKRRKKRKKKNKVLPMTRVKSRENIVEMPMISESESECDSESGDEEFYDDGSSYAASSGCSTPDRGSRSSSRASSPQKSPREDELPGGPNGRSNIEFVIEAPEFPNDVFAKATTYSEDLFAEDNKKQVFCVDENLPPNLALRPKMTIDQEDLKQRLVAGGNPKVVAQPRENRLERRPLEMDNSIDLNDSLIEENDSVMERMLPLPWLDNKSKKSSNRLR